MQEYMKSSSNKNFLPGKMVMKDIGADGKKIEKETALKVSTLFHSYLSCVLF